MVDKNLPRYGAVAILDALGASSFDLASAQKFFALRKTWIRGLSKFSTDIGVKFTSENVRGVVFLKRPVYRTFGDTVIVIWPSEHPFDSAQLHAIGRIIGFGIASGLDIGLAWRGALSIGDFVLDSTSVIGPAIADAANWYERADWIGVVGTPRTLQILRSLGVSSPAATPTAPFGEYHVPMTSPRVTSSIPLAVANWPSELLRLDDGVVKLMEKETRRILEERIGEEYPWRKEFWTEIRAVCRSSLANRLGKFSIPKGTETKYHNTTLHFETVLNAESSAGDKHSLLVELVSEFFPLPGRILTT